MLPGSASFLVPAGGPALVTSTQWRFRSTAGFAGGYWDMRQVSSGQGVFSSGDLTGTNHGASLGSYPTNWSFRNSGGAENSLGAGYQSNPFASGSGTLSSNTIAVGAYFWLVFGSPINIGSVAWSSVAGFNRDATSMELEYWDGSAWVSYATLTNSGYITTPKWRNITQGGTIAAAAS